MNKHFCSSTLACILALPLAEAAQTLVGNGSFESPSKPVGTHYHLAPGALGPWHTTESQFEIWANPGPGTFAQDGTQHLEILDSASASSVFQSIPTTPGELYTLSFFHSPRPTFDSTLTVWVDANVVGTFNELGSAISVFDWQEFSTVFTATGATTTITFADAAATAAGTHIDNVRVTIVPEPASALLLLFGGAICLCRRSFRTNERSAQQVMDVNRPTAFQSQSKDAAMTR